MSPEASAAAGIGYACFVIACVLYVLCLLKDDNYLGRLAMTTQTGGLLLWGAGWVWALVSSGDWPQLGAHDVLLWLVLVCVTASLLVERLHDMRVHSPWVLVLVLLLGGVVMFGRSRSGTRPWRHYRPVAVCGRWHTAFWRWLATGARRVGNAGYCGVGEAGAGPEVSDLCFSVRV